MNKLYYDDPLKAAYMAREFGVFVELSENANTNSADVILKDSKYHPNKVYYIHPNSYAIFEPQEGDLISMWDGDVENMRYITHFEGEKFLSWNSKQEPDDWEDLDPEARIILRDNKHFFMPEVENERE